MVKRCIPLLTTLVLLAGQDSAASAQSVPAVGAGSVSARYEDGLVSISCSNAPLKSVFEKLEEVAGIELILEDAVKNARLTADLEEVPLAMAVQRLLAGTPVNYAVMMDPRDWGRVDKVFVGAGGGGPARSAPPPRRPPARPAEPVDDGYDDFDNLDEDVMDENDDFNDMNDDLVDDPNNENAQDDFTAPAPSYLPPQQAFPRSNFTPGLPGSAVPSINQGQPNGQQPPPPGTMPFMDALGRPIPVPPNVNQQEQRRRQQQQQ